MASTTTYASTNLRASPLLPLVKMTPMGRSRAAIVAQSIDPIRSGRAAARDAAVTVVLPIVTIHAGRAEAEDIRLHEAARLYAAAKQYAVARLHTVARQHAAVGLHAIRQKPR